MHPNEYQAQREASMHGRKLRAPEAARHLGVSTSTLAKWRVYGTGPSYAKLGSIVVYGLADLDAFAAARRRSSTSDSMQVA
jgi:predicted DNA-binding transcriptional regulator AlpA